MKPVMITIPQPCHENWNAMSAAEKGRYCNSCSKQVIDFSGMSDAEINNYLNKTTDKVCGRFDTAQLNRRLAAATHESGLFKHLWKLLLPGFFFSVKAAAQKEPTCKQEPKDSLVRTNPKPMILGMVVRKIRPVEKEEEIITAKVTDGNDGSPISFASVLVKGTKTGTTTDADGNFSLKITDKMKKGVLQLSAAGFETKELAVKEMIGKLTPTVQLIRVSAMMTGEVVVTRVSRKKNNKNTRIENSKVFTKNDLPVKHESVKIFPNPVKAGGIFSIELSNAAKDEVQAIVMDVNGKLVQQSKFYIPGGNYVFNLDLNKDIAAGPYFINVYNSILR